MKKYADMSQRRTSHSESSVGKRIRRHQSTGADPGYVPWKTICSSAGSFHGNDERIKQRFKSEM